MTQLSPLPVLVTGIGGGGHGEQVLKALRLGSRPYFIVGTDTNTLTANRCGVDAFEVVPPASDADYLNRILELTRRYNVRAVFHGSEAEMVRLSRERSKFGSLGVYLPINPERLLDLCQDKVKTLTFFRAQGVRVPEFLGVSSLDEVSAFTVLPAILKPSVAGGGSANVFVAQTVDELRTFASYLLTIYPTFIIQEYIGIPEQEFTVGVLYGADGALLNSIAVRRLLSNALSVRTRVPNRTDRRELGNTLVVSSGISQGVVGHWPEITSQCEQIAAMLQPTAPINIQCRVVQGSVIPFEVNPRFSGTTSLRAMAGYNEPDVLIRRDVLGEKIEDHFAYREVTIMRSLHENEVGG